MKMLSAIILFIICLSCTDTDSKTNELNQRITGLEQKIDSLTQTKSQDTVGYSTQRTPNQTTRCKATTQKGTLCKRKAKSNGYCWQHGG